MSMLFYLCQINGKLQCDNTWIDTVTHEKSTQQVMPCWKCQVVTFYINTIEDYWWFCEGLEGLSQVMGEIWTTISCKSVLRGIWKQGVGGEIGNGIEPLSVPMVWMLVFLASLKCVVASCPHKSEVLDLRKNRCSEDHLERSLHK